jgi:putative flavoprotein involved in K+ transport
MGRVHEVDILSEVNDSPAPSSAEQMGHQHSPETIDRPLVIGAGPGGLSAAWALKRAGLAPVIVERTEEVCSSWRGHYRNLRLNSPRRISSLPGARMERRLGRWVAREDFIGYVERYAEAIQPDIRFGVKATKLHRDGDRWRLATSQGEMHARSVVLATGLNALPHLPRWPGIEDYRGELLHAASYLEPSAFRGRDVLIVGLGASGTDIALELARNGAQRVCISVRTSPLIFRRHLSTAVMSQLIKHASLPDFLVDRLSLLLHEQLWGDLSPYGLGRPSEGMAKSLSTRGHGATMDRGLIGALKCGRIAVVPAVERFHPDGVELADGTIATPNVVIAATGQRPDLHELVGHLNVLGPQGGRPAVHGAQTSARAPGLYFLGYRLPAGQLPDMAIDARAIARRIAREQAAGSPSQTTESLSYVPSPAISDSVDGMGKSLP